MGFFSKLLRKRPVNMTAHILDPISGYLIQTWAVGSEDSDDTMLRLADGTNIYVVNAYVAGELKQIICKREVWLSTKAQMDAIDDASQAGKAITKEMMDKLQ